MHKKMIQPGLFYHIFKVSTQLYYLKSPAVSIYAFLISITVIIPVLLFSSMACNYNAGYKDGRKKRLARFIVANAKKSG